MANEAFRLYDNKERAFVSNKEYASESTANKAAERKNQEYGASRYSAEKYSDVVRRNTPAPRGGGGGGRGGFNFGAMKPGVSPAADNLLNLAKGGVAASRRADGIAQRGKTRGKIK